MNLAQLQALAASVGFPDAALAAAVAMAESGGNPNAVGDLSLGRSIGLWQINLAAHPQYDEAGLMDPTTNADAAYTISQAGQNWNPWTTYRTGAYLKYYTPSAASAPRRTNTRALWISTGILAAGGATLWWLTRTPSQKRRIRRMLPA